MIARRRQKFTLDAFRDLAVFLRGVREERKAIIAVTDGFSIVSANPKLMDIAPGEAPPPGPQVTVDPRTGRLGTKDTSNNTVGVSQTDCWRDRMELANYDGRRRFQSRARSDEPRECVVLPGQPARAGSVRLADQRRRSR